MTRSCCNSGKGDAFETRIVQNIKEIRERMEAAAVGCGRAVRDISLMAVTKTVPPERVNLALREGIPLLGENRVKECCEKYQSYTCKRDQIHLIGHLQCNKISAIIDKVSMIESVDSLHLAKALQKALQTGGRTMAILLQVNPGREETKGGFPPEELSDAYFEISSSCPSLIIRGLMAIPPRTQSDLYLGRLHELFLELQEKAVRRDFLTILSMGMSEDYERAIRFGSTQVRLGRAIFGERALNATAL